MKDKSRKNNNWEETYYNMALHHLSDEKVSGKKLEKIISFINTNQDKFHDVLEIGCGEASLCNIFKDNINYVGIDVSNYAIERAKKKYVNKKNVFLSVGFADKIEFPDKHFDLIIAIYSLEHFNKPKESILEMKRLLKKDGILIICAPNLELPISYPSALRHKKYFYRFWFFFIRLMDYILRLLGIYKFRIISENYLEATGHYEHGDDDLRYLVSSFEVINFLKKNNFSFEYINRLDPSSQKGIKSKLRRFFVMLPGLKYYGTELFIISKKHE